MKTIACFILTWITSTAMLFWVLAHRDTHQQLDFGGAQVSFTSHAHLGKEFWTCLWIAAIYSVVNTLIVRFWQIQSEFRKRS